MSDDGDHILPEGAAPGDGDRILSAEYVLGLLSPGQAAAFESRLASEPALRDITAGWADDFVAMTDTIPPRQAPRRVWRAIETELWPETHAASTHPARGARFRLGRWLGGAMVAAMLGVLVVQSNLLAPPQPGLLAEIGTAQSAAHFTAAYDPGSGELSIERLGPEAPSGRSYELWLIAGDAAPVSVVVWPEAAERKAVALPTELAEVLPGAVLAISDEPFGGSPTGAPTGAVLATGAVVQG